MAKTYYALRGIGGLEEGSEVVITGEPDTQNKTAVIGMYVVANISGRKNHTQHSLKLSADPEEREKVGDTYVNKHLLGILATSAAYDAFRGLHTSGSKMWDKEIRGLEKFLKDCLKTETGVAPNDYNSYKD